MKSFIRESLNVSAWNSNVWTQRGSSVVKMKPFQFFSITVFWFQILLEVWISLEEVDAQLEKCLSSAFNNLKSLNVSIYAFQEDVISTAEETCRCIWPQVASLWEWLLFIKMYVLKTTTKRKKQKAFGEILLQEICCVTNCFKFHLLIS